MIYVPSHTYVQNIAYIVNRGNNMSVPNDIYLKTKGAAERCLYQISSAFQMCLTYT